MLNFKMRLYPTAEQERRLEETCEVNHIVYNYFVSSKLRSRNDMNYECDVCGCILDRDHNSSMVIDDRGRCLLGLPMRHREVTPVDDRVSVAEAGTSPLCLAVGS